MATKKQKLTNNNKGNLDNFVSQLKLGESYTSLILGAIVVIVGLILILSFLRHKTFQTQQTGSISTAENQQNIRKTYIVKQGDDLWHIAQSVYGSGYNWVDLAIANNLSSPSVLYVDTKIIVPNVKPREPTSDQVVVTTKNKITGTSYTVEEGDFLWDIAVRAYGDGFRWVNIAKANNLANPDLIYSGNVLKLPR